ncbi:MAG: hypothetical protein ABIS67_08710 [Candidatus Eisenbacteria bacterium]
MSRWTVLALAGVAVWLVLQNSLLLVWFSSQHVEPVFVVARALLRVGLHLAADLWMIPAAVVLGVALALSGGGRKVGEGSQEVSRV